jgi:S1-C subfamily serine protease
MMSSTTWISALTIGILASVMALANPLAAEELSATAPVGTPIDTDSAGKSGDVAIKSVVHVICPKENWNGSGFMHKSGKILTAEHVVQPCTDIIVLPAAGGPIKATVVAQDVDHDLALLALASPLNVPPLSISARTDFKIGAQVSTWGFPGGYGGQQSLLSIGYLSGRAAVKKTDAGNFIFQWVVNAAFNGGNSGGPLIDIESGDVIGVVASKLAPITPSARSALEALENQKSGFIYTGTRPDGSKFNVSEGQVIAMVLEDLRNQVQLVVGTAVLTEDVRDFLRAQNITP